MLGKFEPNCIVWNVQELSDKKKTGSFKTILTKLWQHFVRHFCGYNNYLMKNYKFSNYHFSVSQKWWQSNMYNQVKSCTKHGRPVWNTKSVTLIIQNICIIQIIILLNLYIYFNISKSPGYIVKKNSYNQHK